MFDRFGDEARAVVSSAEEEAQRLGHDHIGTEHIVLGLLSSGNSTARVLRAAGATLDGCRSKVEELVGPPRGSGNMPATLGLTERAQRALTRADRLSLRRRHDQVDPDHILASLLDVEGTAGQVLRGMSVDVAELRISVSEKLDGVDRPVPLPDLPDKRQVDGPRCATCSTPLGDGPKFRLVESEDSDGHRRATVIIYCRSCGSVFGASSV